MASSSSSLSTNENRLRFSRGQLYAKGERISSAAVLTADETATVTQPCIAAQQKRDGEGASGYHITIATKDEITVILARIAADQDSATPLTGDAGEAAILALINDRIDHNEWASLGLGRAANGGSRAYYRVIIWPCVARIRVEFGLPPRHLHITVGFAPTDVHDIDKGVNSVIKFDATRLSELVRVTELVQKDDKKAALTLLDYANDALLSDPTIEATQPSSVARLFALRSNVLGAQKRYFECKEDAARVTRLRPNWLIGWIRLGGACMALKEMNAAVTAFKTGAELWLKVNGGTMSDSVGTRSVEKKAQKAAARGETKSSPGVASSSSSSSELEPLLGCRDVAERDKEVELMSRMLRTSMSRLSYELKEVDPRERHWVYVLNDGTDTTVATAATPATVASAKKPAATATTTPPSLLHVKMPRNFSWLLPGKLAGVSVPKRRDQLVAMDALGIRLLVTCMSEGPLPAEFFTATQVTSLYYPVVNYKVPTIEWTDEYLARAEDVIQNGGAVCVHCGGGKGRAGTFLACFLIKHGLSGNLKLVTDESNFMSPGEVIQLVRKWRPGSIETVEQEDFIKQYATLLWKRADEGKPVGVVPKPGGAPAKTAGSASPRGGNSPVVAPKKSPSKVSSSPSSAAAKKPAATAPPLSLADDTSSPAAAPTHHDDHDTKDVVASTSTHMPLTDAERKKAVKDSPKIVILAGLPGSGKSTFGSLLESLNDDPSLQANWTRVCQDDLKSRAACDAAVEKASKSPMARIIIDRCNDDSKDRVAWLRLAKATPKNSVCVWFNVPAEECARRVAARRGHPTIPFEGEDLGYGLAKSKASMIVRSFAKKMQPPTKGEGYGTVYTVTTISEANDLLRTWGWDESWPARKRQLQQAAVAAAIATPPSAAGAATATPPTPSPSSTTTTTNTPTVGAATTAAAPRAPPPGFERPKSPATRLPSAHAKTETKVSSPAVSSPATPTPTVAAPATVDDAKEEFICKFPRTHHLFDTGGSAVSSDDLVLATGDELGTWFGPTARELVVQEKIDGANLGISLTADYQVLCQNRSHYVNASSHSQFNNLDTWINTHKKELCEVLVPGRHILFGEWCRAQHSVFYSRLPDYFLAFDIWDRQAPPLAETKSHGKTAAKKKPAGGGGAKKGQPADSSSIAGTVGRFLSYSELVTRLAGTTIAVVPLVCRRTFATRDELIALLETQSSYTDGFLEGVYLRVDEPAPGIYNEKRCKLVRPDFIQGIEDHWMKKKMVKNIVAFD